MKMQKTCTLLMRDALLKRKRNPLRRLFTVVNTIHATRCWMFLGLTAQRARRAHAAAGFAAAAGRRVR